jgi:hypothetical protein
MPPRFARLARRLPVARVAVLATVLLAAPGAARAQSLRGSTESVDAMYDFAQERGLAFHRTQREVRSAAARGSIVRLASDRAIQVRGVKWPWVRETTLRFVERLGAEYREECGERLVVTSAVRPLDRQPANGSPKSVHPTGIAVDLRKPRRSRCLAWLRTRLLELESAGVIEATEEFHPPHFHVAVFSATIRRSELSLGEER